MKLNDLNNNRTKNNKEIISVGLLGISALMVVLIVFKVTAFLAAPARAEDSVKRAIELSKPDAEEVEKQIAKSKAIADELKKKNLFAPPPPKKHPVSKVIGILGDEALINGKWYKAGDRIGDANIVAIEPSQVRVMWDGREKIFRPIEASSSSSPGPGRPGRPVAKADQKGSPETVQVQLEVRGGEGMGRFEGDRGDMMERIREMRGRFENMSPEERERFRAEMRERFGGRGPGGGGPGGRRGGRGRRD